MRHKVKALLLIATFSLFSCGGETASSVSSSLISSSSSESRVFHKAEKNENAILNTLRTNYGTPGMGSLGNQKILVVPVIIKGYEANATEEVRADIEKSFFGSKEETAYESVKSFYNSSSYGKLTLDGSVTSWFDPNVTPSELASHQEANSDDGGLNWLLDQVTSWVSSTYENLQEYDVNQDGYVDSIYLVYSAPNYHNDENLSSFYWAFTYNHTSNMGKGNIDSPVAMMYSWSSFDGIYQGYGKDQIDAHTYIHETGHLLGLPDFYDTGNSNVAPMGKVDMMDYDIGDHSMYSKYALGWSEPYVIDGSGTITLGSATQTGDFLIVKTENMNNTPFDEYIMMEYITPTGLNEKDYIDGYQKYWDTEPQKGYQTAGLRITYINSLAINENLQFEDDLANMIGVKFDNTPRGNVEGFMSPEGQYYLVSTMIPKNCNYGNNGLSGEAFHASSRHLFVQGDHFDLQRDSQYRQMMPHATNKYFKEDAGFFKYNVDVVEADGQTCTISFEAY